MFSVVLQSGMAAATDAFGVGIIRSTGTNMNVGDLVRHDATQSLHVVIKTYPNYGFFKLDGFLSNLIFVVGQKGVHLVQ